MLSFTDLPARVKSFWTILKREKEQKRRRRSWKKFLIFTPESRKHEILPWKVKKSRISSASCVGFLFVVFWSIVCASHRRRFGINRAPAAWCLKLLYRMQFEVLSGWLTCLVMQIEDGVVASDRAQNFKTFFYNIFVICRFPQSFHFSRCRLECLNSIDGIARPEPERNVFEAQKN